MSRGRIVIAIGTFLMIASVHAGVILHAAFDLPGGEGEPWAWGDAVSVLSLLWCFIGVCTTGVGIALADRERGQ